jgi:uncharacterized protein YyaL (SSP411 family)
MPNKLAKENSPYLLQHAENPVDWYPWSEEALKKAIDEDKPIFLSVGYSACHWCHVMEHESFIDVDTASIMNKYFINIKVDREERPDIDSIYMQAVVAMTGQGGWPMSVFLTPEGNPFFGGTYYPPVRRYNMPSFKEILETISRIWKDDRDQLLESSQKISQHLKLQMGTANAHRELNSEKLDQAAQVLTQAYDWKYGGWGQAPKFPQPMVIDYLLRRGAHGDNSSLEMANHALKAMAKGGMYDVIGGGFARYSVDNSWHTPHFEKMLYDNAQLALVYLRAFLLTHNDNFRRVCEETLNFVTREMTHSQGGFFSSLDADSEGIEGKFYIWSPQEIQEIIPDPQDSTLILAAYGITKPGNFEGRNILQQVLDDEQLSEEFNIPINEVPSKKKALHKLLLKARALRIRPATDDKILVFWNSLTLMAFAEAGRYLGREDYTQTAINNATFLMTNLYQGDRLFRSWRAGQVKYNAYLEDYAGLALSLLALYQSDPNPKWYQFALKLADEIVTHFRDSEGGFFDTREDHETLLLRPKDTQDNATPSGNSLSVMLLLQLAAYGDRTNFREMADQTLAFTLDRIIRYPIAFAQWLSAADFAINPTIEVAILGNSKDSNTQELIKTLWQTYRPDILTAISAYPPDKETPALLSNRHLINDMPTAYVCRNFVCRYPVNSPSKLSEQLDSQQDQVQQTIIP